jgi:inositol oxygenase
MAAVVLQKHALELDETEGSSAKRPQAEDVGADRRAEEFRNYKDSALQERVSGFYHTNHRQQTREVVQKIMAQLETAPVVEMTAMEAIEVLNNLVDESDPDLDAAQTFHAFQTAEAARRVFPNDKWIHVCGLIHDIGKVLADPRFGAFPQSFVVGDTFPLGCRYSDKIVFSEYFSENPDSAVPAYQTETGVYAPNCGLRNVLMSFGHDEYLYRVLVDSKVTLPEEVCVVEWYALRWLGV